MMPGATATVPRHRRGALSILVVLLVVSGLLRLGLTADQAFGRAEAETVPRPPAAAAADEGALQAMLARLTQREAVLREREARIGVREQAVALAAAETEKRIGALEAAEATLAATLARADQATEKDVGRLVTVYEKMKPKDAAQLFSQMEPDFAAGFIARMKPEAAASVMASLDPKVAYAISVYFAGRNAAAPKS